MNVDKIENLENRKFKIYCLKCPVTLQIRYIGVTVNTLSTRLSQHIFDAKKGGTYKRNWIASLSKKPVIELIEECNYSNWEEREKYWISYYDNLTNTKEGGVGIVLNRSEESRYKSIKAKFKKIIAISQDKTFIKKYNSLKECSEDLNIPSPSITWVLRFPNKSSYGYHFVYAEKYYPGYENNITITDAIPRKQYKYVLNGIEIRRNEVINIIGCKNLTLSSWESGRRSMKKSKFLKNHTLDIIMI